MTLIVNLSDGNTATLERDSKGLRIIESSYDWINPPVGRVFYLEESCLQGGKISVWEYDADEKGAASGMGQLVTSGRSIVNHRLV